MELKPSAYEKKHYGQLVGKTVASIRFAEYEGKNLPIIVFTDGTTASAFSDAETNAAGWLHIIQPKAVPAKALTQEQRRPSYLLPGMAVGGLDPRYSAAGRRAILQNRCEVTLRLISIKCAGKMLSVTGYVLPTDGPEVVAATVARLRSMSVDPMVGEMSDLVTSRDCHGYSKTAASALLNISPAKLARKLEGAK